MTGDLLPISVPEAAQAARACPVFDAARRLATWLGTGRPVTPKGVLRPGDVPEAARVLGTVAPSKIRSAADVLWLHEPWTAAVDCGLVTVEGKVARAGGALADWVGGPDETVLGIWWRAFRASIEAWDDPDDLWSGIPTIPVASLCLLAAGPGPFRTEEFTHRVLHLRGSGEVVSTAAFWELTRDYDKPMDVIVGLVTRFGAVSVANGKTWLTALGRYALDRVAMLTPPVVIPTMSAAEVLVVVERLDEALAWRRAAPWLAARTPIVAARELLTAAASAAPMHRMAALALTAGLDDTALPAWREAAELTQVGPAARAFLAREFGDPEPGAEEIRWQVVDECAALLDEEGAALALPEIWENLPGDDVDTKIAAVEATAHPHGRHLTEELRQYAAAGASRPTPAVHQVKLSLKYVRSPVWRRVQVPSDFPLGGLHLVIQAAMGWDGDHLHQFTVDRRHFSDPGYDLDAQDEWRARLVGVLPRPGLSASYLYDFGDSWEHTIKVEKVGEAEVGATYPRCTAGKGTRPGEDGGEPEPFDMERINRRLASILTAS